MTDILTTVEFAATSGLVEDNATWNLAWSTASTADATTGLALADIIKDNIERSYDGGVAYPLSRYLSPSLSRAAGGVRVRCYDITGKLLNVEYVDSKGRTRKKPPAHGSPFYETPLAALGAAGSTIPWPNEVALAVTLEALGRESQPVEAPDNADPGSEINRPRSRSTGRVFVGPLCDNVSGLINGIARPEANFRRVAAEAFLGMARDGEALTTPAYLSVWSRQDGVLRPVANVSVDDAWDTQRRRGQDPTVRNRYPVAV